MLKTGQGLRGLRAAFLLGVAISSLSTLPAAAQSAQPAAEGEASSAAASSPEEEKLRLLSTKRYPGHVYVLPATMETTQWGWFNNAQPPASKGLSLETF